MTSCTMNEVASKLVTDNMPESSLRRTLEGQLEQNNAHFMNQPHNFHLILQSGTASTASAASRRQSRAHAARAGHARTRLARTIEYKARTRAAQGVPEVSISAGPLSLLGQGRRDPFSSFPIKPNHTEWFLIDHCELCPTLSV